MSYKPPMPDEDIAALADELRPLWRKGQPVLPWLRKHAPRLIELQRDEWTWASLGKALTCAGITYQTNRPWDGEHLRVQVSRATRPLKRQNRTVSVTTSPAEDKCPPGGGHRAHTRSDDKRRRPRCSRPARAI